LIHEKPTEEIRELAALFSLGTLPENEVQRFETHIREGCSVCEAEFRKFKHIVAEIGLAVNEVAAPEYIREIILTRIERKIPSEAVEKPKTESAEQVKPAAEEPKIEPTEQVKPKKSAKREPPPTLRPILTQTSMGRPSFFPWILAAILAVITTLTFLAYRSQQSANIQLKDEIASVRSDLEDFQILLDIQKGRQGESDQIISTVSKPETRILHLSGLSPAPSSSGAILLDVQSKKCLVFGYMPLPTQGKTYQLWYMTPSTKIPSGTFKPGPSGRIYEQFPIPEDITSMTPVITLEPEGGSMIPTSAYYAIGRNN
jgi:anti-sigma-K factor RskA